MDVRDGFIVGIFNYCDRWCEACAFTSRCRVFADVAEAEAAHDPNLLSLVQAPPLPEDEPPAPRGWIRTMIEELGEALRQPAPDDDLDCGRPALTPELEAIQDCAHGYCDQTHAWLRDRNYLSIREPSDARAVVGWFHTVIPAKIARALDGLVTDIADERDWPADHDGSAKVALLGIERSHAAWLEIVDQGLAPRAEVEPFVAALVWLRRELARAFPNARAFVRPAFDEPDEVAALWAAEAGR